MMRSVLIIAFLHATLSCSAQKTFSEGTIAFDLINIVDGKKVDSLASYIQMVKGVHYRSDLVSSIGKTSTIFDMREGAGAVVRDFGSQKTITLINRANWREIHKEFSELNYTISADTISILGYTCHKANATLSDGAVIEVFFTRSLLPDHAELFTQLGNIPGLILGFSSTTEVGTINYIARSLTFDPVQIQQFDIPSTGYRLLEYEESKKK
jgi:GLPGLI family protein